ncbi:hypothetical protein [Spiroplasma clarkii]|uniref:hypothetical protein n=1 Tax=Spiroplasma clarkii TaxID=2139 RepID=UPI001649F894|nr:hypothetical protein [Spiroplasma clarkii]
MVDKVKLNYLPNTHDIGHFEKIYIAQIISSNISAEIKADDLASKTYTNYFQKLRTHFEKLGYDVNHKLNLVNFVKTCCYFELIPFKNLFDGNWLYEKIKNFKNCPELKKYIKDLQSYFSKNEGLDFKTNLYNFYLLASVFLTGITKFPVPIIKFQPKDVVLISNLKTINLNLWIHKVLNKYKSIESYCVISPQFYLLNKADFKHLDQIANQYLKGEPQIVVVLND